MKAIVGVAWDDPAKRYGTALTATFVKETGDRHQPRKLQQQRIRHHRCQQRLYARAGLRHAGLDRVLAGGENVRLNGGVYNLTDRKYWDYLSSRNIETGTNRTPTIKRWR